MLNQDDDIDDRGQADPSASEAHKGDSEGEQTEFLTVDQVIDLHSDAIRRYSPSESYAIRDRALLESAVLTPQQSFSGQPFYSTLTEMAAAYMIGLAGNHPFENGNKRVAFAACSAFLRMNGFLLTLTQEEAIDLTMRLASHKIERDEIVKLLDSAIDLL